MKRAYTMPPAVEKLKAAAPAHSARLLQMHASPGACTLCGSSTALPHGNGHACILALDEEIAVLIHKTHTLRKYRAQLLASRAQLYRDILKRSSGRI